MSKLSFNPEINLGHVLVIVSILGSSIIFGLRLEAKIELQGKELSHVTEAQKQMSAKLDGVESRVNQVYYKSLP